MGARIRGSGHGAVSTEMRVILYPATPVSAGMARVRPVQAAQSPTNPRPPRRTSRCGLTEVKFMCGGDILEQPTFEVAAIKQSSQLLEQMATRMLLYLFNYYHIYF